MDAHAVPPPWKVPLWPAHGPGVVGEDGKAEVHGLLERHAEAFVLRQAEEEVGELVVGHEVVVVHVAGEDDLVHA